MRSASFVAVAAFCGATAACGGSTGSPVASSPLGASHAVSGVVVESGGGPLPGVVVTATSSGLSATTGASGAYQLAAPGPTSIDLAKAGYEPMTYGQFPLTRDTTVNGVLQPMLRMATAAHLTATIFPDDNVYPVSGGAALTLCGPCKVIHVDASGATDVVIDVRWGSAAPLTLWGFGRSISGTSPIRVVARAAAGDNRLYVGVAVGLSAAPSSPISVDLTTAVVASS